MHVAITSALTLFVALASAPVAVGQAADSVERAFRSGCWTHVGPGHNSNHDEDSVAGTQSAAWRTSRCSGTLWADGVPLVSADTTSLIGLPSGGEFRITEREGAIRRDIRVSVASDGSLEYDGRLNGRQVPPGVAARWIRAHLRPLVRFTRFAVSPAGLP